MEDNLKEDNLKSENTEQEADSAASAENAACEECRDTGEAAGKNTEEAAGDTVSSACGETDGDSAEGANDNAAEDESKRDEKSDEKNDEKNKDKGFFARKKQNAEIDKLNKLNETLVNENAGLKEKYARLAAEYDNYRKRTAKENETRYADAKADVWKSIIGITDDFERALKADVPEACGSYVEGVKLIYKKITDAMAASGIEEIKAIGEQFDPSFHNAVMHIESEDAGENEIIEVFEKGYKLGDKVIRHSMVKVAN